MPDETRLPLAEAITADGRDVTEILARRDGQRHSLRPHLDSVTLRFVAPQARTGRARTVLVEATGYYQVIVLAKGEPQREVFRRLVEEPGAVARFALDSLRAPRSLASSQPD
jgi:hypothetical protein